ncbi:hypothetical protein [Pseudomonas sp. nanlin1]|uniref:hypothetical protein n=1 Tax=Pseudomonas sp. nanlin1 TaxID=3040605 RepID=UPI00388DE6C9
MSYSFSIKLTSDSPDNLAIRIADLSPQELTERFKPYNFDVSQGHAIRFDDLRSAAHIIIENTGAEAFVWEDNQPRIRLHLKPGQRKQVSIAATTGALYPYSEARKERADYFEAKEVEMFEHTVICLFFAGTRRGSVAEDNTIEKLKKHILDVARRDHKDYKQPDSIVKELPINKAEFFALHYAPAHYPIRRYPSMGRNVEWDKLTYSRQSDGENFKMTNEQVSGLAAPLPAQHFIDNGIEPPGHFVGFQYLVLKPGGRPLEDVEFYVAAPPPQ